MEVVLGECMGDDRRQQFVSVSIILNQAGGLLSTGKVTT